MRQEIPWNRFSVEAFVIVGSILLAFVIDAWWEERQERIAEHAELTRLHAELVSNREAIDRGSRETSNTQRNIAAALRISKHLEEMTEDGAEVISLSNAELGGLLGTPTLELETSVFDSLIRSGRLEIVGNPSIVEAIGRWDSLHKNAQETQRDGRVFVQDRLLPAITENNNLQQVLLNQGPGSIGELDLSGTTTIKIDVKLINLVAQTYFLTRMAQRQWTRLGDHTDTTIEEISKFLNN